MALAAPFPAARARTAAARRSSTLRLTRRGRALVVLASALFLFLAVLASGRISADAETVDSGAGAQARATGSVVVQPGENLWKIAEAVAPGADPRETVATIRALNGLGAGPVTPGQALVVPVG